MITVAKSFPRLLTLVCLVVIWAVPANSGAFAQNAISFLPHVDVRFSSNGTGSGASEVAFSTGTQSLTCPASGIVATISSTADGTGNVLVDNFVNLTVTHETITTGPANICRGGIVESGGQQDCFTSGYQVPASAGELTGDDPDGSLAVSGGVAPIDISSALAGGVNTVELNLVDTGGYLAATSTYLYTNCTSNGAVGGGKISGNPIPSTNPPANLLTQDFTFASGTNGSGTPLAVQLVFDLSTAYDANTLDITNGATPTVVDQAVDPTLWPAYVAGTSFATSQCLIHNGELLNNSPACKLYTLTCQIGQGSGASGVQCPTSTARNIVIQDAFDFPPLFLPDIQVTVHGQAQTFHQGFGFLEADEGWTGGPCTFDPAAGQMFSCPENLLTEFNGPGFGRATGTPQPGINSSFISVGPVPEDQTDICYKHFEHSKWVNTREVKASLRARPPIVPAPNNGFVASPIYSITYGVSPGMVLPSTEFPVPGDQTLYAPGGCPGTTPAQPFNPEDVAIKVEQDGKYLVHYFATDCAGTEELFFYQDRAKSWNTTFYAAELNVDTVKPEVIAGPILSPPPASIGGELGYYLGQKVTAAYQCSDNLSGVEKCGEQFYANPVTNPSVVTTTVDTSKPGTKMFTVHVWDAAANEGRSESVAYTVVNSKSRRKPAN